MLPEKRVALKTNAYLSYDIVSGSDIMPCIKIYKFVLFFCFVVLPPKSTAKVMVGRSVHLTTLFPGQV